MHCPQCHSEYREDVTECADCQVPLVGTPGRAGPAGPEMITVLECSDPVVLAVAQGSLDTAGIDYLVSTKSPGWVSLRKGTEVGTSIQVAPRDADDARVLLAPLAG